MIGPLVIIEGLDWENLKLYYRFDQGDAAGSNLTEDQVFDYSQYAHHGTLSGLDLTGVNANWLESTAPLGMVTLDKSAHFKNAPFPIVDTELPIVTLDKLVQFENA